MMKSVDIHTDLTAIGSELAAQKEVHQKDLADHVDKVEELAEVELDGVPVVLVVVPWLLEVVQEFFYLLCFLFGVNDGNDKTWVGRRGEITKSAFV